MELRQLTYFLAIANCENMTHASKMLHVSQPTLSTALRDLERELGFPLFTRSGKRLELNESGRQYAKRVQEAVNLLEEAQRTARTTAQRRERIVNCAVQIPVGHPGELLRLFHEQYPDIVIRMGYPDSNAFSNQTIDLELFGSQIIYEEDRIIPLGKESYVAILPVNHRLAQEDPFMLRMLKDEPFVFSDPSDLRSTVEGMCHEAGFSPKIITETQLYSEVLSIVESGIACTIGTTFTWLASQRFNVIAKPCHDVSRVRYLYARLPEAREPSNATKVFIDFFRTYVQSVEQP